MTDTLEQVRRAGGRTARVSARGGSEVTATAREEARAYEAGEERPLGGYAALLGVYGATGAALAVMLWRDRERLPAQLTLRDLGLLSVATFKLSRLTARDTITSPLRVPFARYRGPATAPSELNEEVRGRGMRHALGELITCPFCLAQWVATGFVAGFLVAPRATRVVAATLTVTALSDALQLGYSAATKAAS